MKSTAASVFLFTPFLLLGCADDAPPPAPVPAELPAQGHTHIHTAEGILEVDYRRDGDHVIIQGDIAVPVDEFTAAMIDPADLDDAIEGGRERAAVRAIGRFRWPGGRVPFRLDANLSAAQLAAANGAMAHWAANTPFQFIARTTETDFVTFVPGTADGACWSQVGRAGGEQAIQINNCGTGAIIHEIGHAVGFWHEHTRYDRNSFITVNTANIDPDFVFAFNRYVDEGRDGSDVGDYDYGSIMHYGTHAFSDNGQATITVLQAGATIGQRTGLSRGDIDAAFRLFSPGGTYDTGPKITLYRNANYSGVSQAFLPGYHSAGAGQFATIGDNTASSIAIPPGMIVEAWTQGVDEPRTYYGTSQPTLAAPFDNNISAVSVQRAVTVYRESSQWGVSQTFRRGEWKANAGQMATIGNDHISSLYVPPGLVAELCTSETGGTCQTYEGSVNYVGDAMNDKASMIRVKAAVTLYQEGNLWGNRKSLTAGTYTAGSFAPVVDNSLSSLIVGDGLKATVCDTSSGGGTCEVFRGDVNYVGAALNDKASWIKIETNTNP
jgi:hypothetical protein